MDGKLQFSLAYLLFVMFLWSVSLGLSRVYLALIHQRDQNAMLWFVAAALSWCPTIGASFGRIRFGMAATVIVAAFFAYVGFVTRV